MLGFWVAWAAEQAESLPNIKTPTKCNDQVLSKSDAESLPNIKTPTKCNDQVLSKSDAESLPNIKTPTKCNDQVLSNSDVKSLPNMLNTNWMQDLYKIIDAIMKTRNHAFPMRFTKRHDFSKSSAPKLFSTIPSNLGTTLATLCILGELEASHNIWQVSQGSHRCPRSSDWTPSPTHLDEHMLVLTCDRLVVLWRAMIPCLVAGWSTIQISQSYRITSTIYIIIYIYYIYYIYIYYSIDK